MQIAEKIRALREIRQWSQEETAAKMNISTNAYSRLERGETRISLERLEKIAEIFNISLPELMHVSDRGLFFLISENIELEHSANYYGNAEHLTLENEKLKLTVQHLQEMLSEKQAILAQKDSEIETLKTLVAVLQKNQA